MSKSKASPSKSTRRETALEKRERLAEHLNELSGGRVKIEFCATSFWDGKDPRSPGSEGHLFSLSIPEESNDSEDFPDETTTMELDDRDGPVAAGVVAQLRKVGAIYFNRARELEAAFEANAPLPPRANRFTLIVVKRPSGWDGSLDEAPPQYDPVAVYLSDVAERDARVVSFNDVSARLSGELWMVKIRLEEALAMELPAWPDVRGEYSIDYECGDVLEFHYDQEKQRAEVAAMLEVIDHDCPGHMICGLPRRLFWECWIRLNDGAGIASNKLKYVNCADVDLKAGVLTIRAELRDKYLHEDRGDKLVDLDVPTVQALEKFGLKDRALLFPEFGFSELLATQGEILRQARELIKADNAAKAAKKKPTAKAKTRKRALATA